MQVDYNTGGTIPTNFGLLYSGSAPKASIQDSNYTQRGWSNGRYNGSSNSSIDFNNNKNDRTIYTTPIQLVI